jgi:hypothetical protein
MASSLQMSSLGIFPSQVLKVLVFASGQCLTVVPNICLVPALAAVMCTTPYQMIVKTIEHSKCSVEVVDCLAV